LNDRRIVLDLSEAAKRHLVKVGYDPVYGARPLKRAVQRELETMLPQAPFRGGTDITRGLLDAATAFLADLRLLRRVPGGVLVLPAAARYRNIKLALPVRHAGDGQMALNFGPAVAGPDGEGPAT